MKKVCIVHDTGNGRLGGHYIEYAYRGLPGVEIAALSDSNPERKEDISITGATKRYYDYREMVYKENPDILVLASRLPQEHFEQINFAIENRCNVLVEKPLVADLKKADKLIENARQNRIHIAIAYLARYAPVFKQLKKMIIEGEIGNILSCHLRGKEDNRGGGEDMMVLGSHLLDLSVYLFGQPKSVYADILYNEKRITSVSTIATDEPIGLTAGDDVFAFYRFANSVSCTFQSRRSLVERTVCTRMGIVVCGTKGSLAVRYDGDRSLRICRNFPVPYEDESSFEVVPSQNTLEKIDEARPLEYCSFLSNPDCFAQRYYANNNRRIAWNLLNAIDGKERLESSAADSLWSLEMIIGAYRSAISGERILLPLCNRSHPLAVSR